MIPRILPEQNLEKRSISGSYIYVGAWLLIGLTTGYYHEQPTGFAISLALLCFFGVTRVWAFYRSPNHKNYSGQVWQSLIIANAIGPALVYGTLFAIAMEQVEHHEFFIYLFMINLALLSGGTVTYSPNRPLAIYFMLSITLPALLTAVLIPQERGVEALMLALYMAFNFHMVNLLHKEHAERIDQKKALEDLARKDSMTGLFNRRYFDESMQICWAKHQRVQAPLSLLILDIDDFKKVNDTFGHPVGDEVIKRVANIVQQNFQREVDIIARLGGEEFAVLIQEADFNKTGELAELICQAIAKHKINTDQGTTSVTASIGLAHAIPNRSFDQEDFYKLADSCLYQAKYEGKNRVISKNISAETTSP